MERENHSLSHQFMIFDMTGRDSPFHRMCVVGMSNGKGNSWGGEGGNDYKVYKLLKM